MRGDEIVDLASLSDPVLVRDDGSYLYTLPSVVDDIDLGITHVIRGEDHVTNTGVQIQIFRALWARSAGLRAPQSADDGERRGAFQAARLAVAEVAAPMTASSRWRSRRSRC